MKKPVTFKAAKCPSCGGDLQVPEDRTTIKCMYCGLDVVVREAISLAAGRVKDYCTATPITRTVGVSSCAVLLLVFGICFLIFTFVALTDSTASGATFTIMLVLAACFLIPGFKWLGKRNEIREVGLSGQCPYCESPINVFHIGGKSAGTDCEACKRRIVIRDNKFISVDTPVSGLRK